MAEKDIAEKMLLNSNHIFSDIVNVLLFDGEELIKPDALEDRIVHAQYKAEDGVLHEEERDVFKKVWSDRACGIELALCGLENQTAPYKFMPARVIGYDGASYREQLLDKNVKRIIPVITIVLNFGMKRWDEPTNLKELFEGIDPAIEKYVNDYHIHVFDIAWLDDEKVRKFKSDFGRIATLLTGQRTGGDDYYPDDRTEIENVDGVLKLLSVIKGDWRYELPLSEKREVKNMCDLVERLEQKGRAEGLAEGMAAGRVEGHAEGRKEILDLFAWLSANGRNDDIGRAVADEDFLESLYGEFDRSKA